MNSSDTESYYDSCEEQHDDRETEINISTVDLLGENYQDKICHSSESVPCRNRTLFKPSHIGKNILSAVS